MPFLVVTMMTPPDPREPYIAADDASFSTSIDSTSFILTLFMLAPGNPSITTRGSLLAEMDPAPLTRMIGGAPGLLLVLDMFTPARRPARSNSGRPTGTWSKILYSTLAIGPVTELFFWVP